MLQIDAPPVENFWLCYWLGSLSKLVQAN